MLIKITRLRHILPLVTVAAIAVIADSGFSIARASSCGGGETALKNKEHKVGPTGDVPSSEKVDAGEGDNFSSVNKGCAGAVGSTGYGNCNNPDSKDCKKTPCKPVGAAKPKCGTGTKDMAGSTDPTLKAIADGIINSKGVSAAVAQASGHGAEFNISWTLVDDTNDKKGALQGIDSPLVGFAGKGKTLVFSLKLSKNDLKKGAAVANRIKGGAGVYPDVASGIRKALAEEVSSVNGLLYEAAAYSKAKLMGELELAALGDRVAYENIKIESGTGEPEKLAEARARALQAEVEVMDLNRKLQVLGNNFLTMTGRDHRGVTLADYDEFLQLAPKDPDFSSMLKTEAMCEGSTEEAAEALQRKANDLLHQGGELMARRFVVDSATEALRRTRERMDEGHSGEAEEASAKALLLGSQKNELRALGEYAKAHCAAYPNVTFIVDTKTQPSVSIAGDTTAPAAQKPGVLWLAALGLGALALIAYFGAPRGETDKRDPENKA